MTRATYNILVYIQVVMFNYYLCSPLPCTIPSGALQRVHIIRSSVLSQSSESHYLNLVKT